MNIQPNCHKTGPEGFYFGSLDQVKQFTMKALDVVNDQYDKIEITFSEQTQLRANGEISYGMRALIYLVSWLKNQQKN